MRSIKINKMAVVWLMTVGITGLGYGSIDWPLMAETENQMYIDGKSPRVSDVFEVVYRVRLKPNISPEFGERNFYVRFGIGTIGVAKVVGPDEVCIPSLVPGVWQEVRTKYYIPGLYKMVILNSYLGLSKGHKYTMVGATLRLLLLDSLTGQYGTTEEYEKGLPVEYRYDFIDGSFIGTYDQTRVSLEENRRIIRMIKELEPALTDSLSLLLHSEQYRVGVPKGVPQWDSLNQRWIEKGVFEYYLKDGWLKAVQDGKIEQWREREKKKIESSWKGGRFNFFRPDGSGSGIGYPAGRDTFYKACDGIWKFKDHLYNKDQGLLAQAEKKGIKQGRARILTTYVSGGFTYRVLTHQNVTNDTGYFSVTIKLPSDATLAKAFPIIYPCGGGSDTASPKISISDPTPTSAYYNKDILDTTLYVIKNMYYDTIYANSESVHFNIIYADTYPEVAQPQSGCINIYETYLHARTFMEPPPTWPLRTNSGLGGFCYRWWEVP